MVVYSIGGGAGGRGELHNEVSYCTDGLGGAYGSRIVQTGGMQ